MKVDKDRLHSGQGKTPPLETALLVVAGMSNDPDCKESFVWIQYTISRLLISIELPKETSTTYTVYKQIQPLFNKGTLF